LQEWNLGLDTDDLLDPASLKRHIDYRRVARQYGDCGVYLGFEAIPFYADIIVSRLQERKRIVPIVGRSCDVHFTGFDLGERYFSVRDRRLLRIRDGAGDLRALRDQSPADQNERTIVIIALAKRGFERPLE